IMHASELEAVFLRACANGKSLYLKLLVIKMTNTIKAQALQTACQFKDFDCVLALLETGLDRETVKDNLKILLKDNDPELKLKILAKTYTYHYLFKLLLELGALKGVKNILLTLVKNRQIQSLEYALKNGFDINQLYHEPSGSVTKCE